MIVAQDLCVWTCAVVVFDMKNTVKITCCGVISALAVVVMLATNIPIALYTVPCIAGLFFIIPTIEFGTKWGFLCYFITSVLSVVLPTEREALVVFIGLLGYYPILKMVIERIGKRLFETIIKFAVFNLSIVASYGVIIKLLGYNVFENEHASVKVTAIALLVAGNAVFWVLDYAITQLIRLYFVKFRKSVRRILGLKGRY